MRKFAKVAAVIAVAGFALTGCADKSGWVEGDTDMFSNEVVIVGGDQFKCLFKNRGQNHGTMSCKNLHIKATPGIKDTDSFSREEITSGGEKYDCIFLNKGQNHGAMSCEPVKA